MDWSQIELQIFARCPSGRLKTRLQPPLTQSQASELHMQLIVRMLKVARSLGDDRVCLMLDRVSEHPWIEQLRARTICRFGVQCGEDLGDRMSHAFEQGLLRHRAVIVLGCDCPVMDTATIFQLAKALWNGCDVALTPAEDGGYVAIGLSRFEPALFDAIDWGSEHVLQQTRARIQQLGLRCHETPALWDLDRPEDLKRLVCERITLPEYRDLDAI